MPRFRRLTWSVKHTMLFHHTISCACAKEVSNRRVQVNCVAHHLILFYHTCTRRRVSVAALIVTSCHVHGGLLLVALLYSHFYSCRALYIGRTVSRVVCRALQLYSSRYASTALQLYNALHSTTSAPTLWTMYCKYCNRRSA